MWMVTVSVRIRKVFFGYLAASALAGVMLAASLWGAPLGIAAVGIAAPVVFAFAAPFALPAISVAEFWRVRSPLFYLLAGSINGIVVLAVVMGVTTRSVSDVGVVLTPNAMNLWFAFVGLCAGLVYWAIAGRTAGACAESSTPAAA